MLYDMVNNNVYKQIDKWCRHILYHIGESQNSSFKSNTAAYILWGSSRVNCKPIYSGKKGKLLEVRAEGEGNDKGARRIFGYDRNGKYLDW